LIGTEELGMQWIRYSGDYVVQLIAGFYRSPDVMGWHAATTVMVSIVLALTSRGGSRWGWVLLAAFAAGALLLCGRRKMVFMIPAFFTLIICLYWALGRRQGWTALLGVALVPVLIVGLLGNWLNEDSTQIRYYADNAADSFDQIEKHGIDSVIETVRQNGLFGSGLGVATPGSHHLNVARPRVWQESGPSRVMVELGVPGFIALLFLVLSLLRASWWVTRYHLQSASPYAGYVVGLMACFTVNIASLVVSGQILADPFIASFIGLTIGIVLSFGRFYPSPPDPAPSTGVMPPSTALTTTSLTAPALDWSPTQIDDDLRYR
jgi:hypothetical protein